MVSVIYKHFLILPNDFFTTSYPPCYLGLHQFDDYFLCSDLYEKVYTDQPPAFVSHGETRMVIKFKKSLDGSKQSRHPRFGRLSQVVIEFGY